MENDPWSVYWRQPQLHSCIAASNPANQQDLAAFWGDFARSLNPAARVLDLATGNGAVPVQLLTAVPTLRITGVDRAAISPAKHVAGEPLLGRVRFCGEVELDRLPRLEGPFEALTSQFGVEYAGPDVAARVLDSHLISGGAFQWLLHHRDSTVVASGARDRTELAGLLAEDGLLAVLVALDRGTTTVADVDDRVRAYLRAPIRRTQRISGAVIALIDRAVTAAEHGDRQPLAGITAHLAASLEAEHERLAQLEAAALDAGDLDRMVRDIGGAGIRISRREPLVLGANQGKPPLIGWVVAGHRP